MPDRLATVAQPNSALGSECSLVWQGGPRARPECHGSAGRMRRRSPERHAALIYQHKTAAAGRAIADAPSAQIESLDQAHGGHADTSSNPRPEANRGPSLHGGAASS